MNEVSYISNTSYTYSAWMPYFKPCLLPRSCWTRTALNGSSPRTCSQRLNRVRLRAPCPLSRDQQLTAVTRSEDLPVQCSTNHNHWIIQCIFSFFTKHWSFDGLRASNRQGHSHALNLRRPKNIKQFRVWTESHRQESQYKNSDRLPHRFDGPALGSINGSFRKGMHVVLGFSYRWYVNVSNLFSFTGGWRIMR